MELSSCDGFAETLVDATQQRSRCPENSLDESGESREEPAHKMASQPFPSTTFHIVIVEDDQGRFHATLRFGKFA